MALWQQPAVLAIDEVAALPREERGRVWSIVARLGSRAKRVLEGGLPSPGEARQVLLTLGAVRDPWLVVLDEPTHHLDLGALVAMEATIVGRGDWLRPTGYGLQQVRSYLWRFCPPEGGPPHRWPRPLDPPPQRRMIASIQSP